MQQLRNLLTTDDRPGITTYAMILVLIAIVVIVAFLFLGEQISAVLPPVGNSV
jgi:Flp pilus assembly pilin Flp